MLSERFLRTCLIVSGCALGIHTIGSLIRIALGNP